MIKNFIGAIVASLLFAIPTTVLANSYPVIMNEYNAISSGKYIDGTDYVDSPKGDAYFASFAGMPDGRVQGNGGNWFELVVTGQNVDMRGWEIRWVEEGSDNGDGTDLWYGDGTIDHGILELSNDDIWNNLQAGTIITFSEQQFIQVDTTDNGSGERNFTHPDQVDGSFEATIDLSTDTSYDPAADDWWIHVSTLEEATSGSPLVTAQTNIDGDGAGNFSVGNNDMHFHIFDASDIEVFSVVEDDFGGISSKEMGKLEADPTPYLNKDDYNDGTSSSFGAPNVWSAGTITQDFTALRNGTIVPEPTAALLMLGGAIGLLMLRRRK